MEGLLERSGKSPVPKTFGREISLRDVGKPAGKALQRLTGQPLSPEGAGLPAGQGSAEFAIRLHDRKASLKTSQRSAKRFGITESLEKISKKRLNSFNDQNFAVHLEKPNTSIEFSSSFILYTIMYPL